jgi:hypothetical protein
MGRNKGEREKVRGDYHLRPENWLDKKSVAFLSKGESRGLEKLERMKGYLDVRKAHTEWYDGIGNGERALLASISRHRDENVEHQASQTRCDVRCYEWAPVRGGESLRQNIPLRTFQDLIRNDNPSGLYCFYIVSESQEPNRLKATGLFRQTLLD